MYGARTVWLALTGAHALSGTMPPCVFTRWIATTSLKRPVGPAERVASSSGIAPGTGASARSRTLPTIRLQSRCGL